MRAQERSLEQKRAACKSRCRSGHPTAAACPAAAPCCRHRAVPLTCRRLSQLVNAPQLLRTVEFDSTVAPVATVRRYLPRAQSFACWAVRHAPGAVRRLLLKAAAHRSLESPHDEGGVVWSEMMGVLAACGTAGSLQEVQLFVQFSAESLSSWLPVALRSVRLLDLDVEEGSLVVDVPLAAMTALEHLRLDVSAGFGGGGLCFSPAASLPPSLTRLHLGGTLWIESPPERLPAQVTGRHRINVCSHMPRGGLNTLVFNCHH